MSAQEQQPHRHDDFDWREWVMWTAIDAAAIWAIWTYVIVALFGAPALLAWQALAVSAAGRILFQRLTDRLDSIGGLLMEMRDIHMFSEQNSAHKYQQIAEFLDKHFSKVAKGIVEAKKDAE